MKKDDMFIKIIVIILSIFAIIAAIMLSVGLWYYSNLEIETLISNIIVFILVGVGFYIFIKNEGKKEKLLMQTFILDIYDKLKDNEHIRITEDYILYKYRLTAGRSGLIFPGPLEPWYEIIRKVQLSAEEVNCIMEKIKGLNNNFENNVLVNIRGVKKLVNVSQINTIFEKYKLKIR